LPDAALIRFETGAKRVRVLLGGEVVADTRQPLLVWEHPYYPAYYIPHEDVLAELAPGGDGPDHPQLGRSHTYDVRVGTATAPAGARIHHEAPVAPLRDAVRLDWGAMDEWLEEDEPVYTHARDPYARVDILASSRHIRVELGGTVLAESRQPRILFETGLPPRYYLPLTDVRVDLLRPSPTVTHCPYKGAATYWSVDVDRTVHQDIVWMYRTPLPESQKVAGLACFYTERLELYVDGERQRLESR
jgi:uncharacterized protein (DUF427 family)